MLGPSEHSPTFNGSSTDDHHRHLLAHRRPPRHPRAADREQLAGDVSGVRYTSYLTRPQLWALDEACHALPRQALGTSYLVGSVMRRPDFRDVDVRMMLDDETYDALPGDAWRFFGFVTSRHLAAVTGLPVDFQIQRTSEANARYSGEPRNPMGMRKLGSDWIGDGRPEPKP